MTPRVSGAAQEKLGVLDEVRRKWDRVHRLVEESANQEYGRAVFWSQIGRIVKELSLLLSNSGMGSVAEKVEAMTLVLRRPTTVRSKVRGMREVVGRVRESLEIEEKAIVTEDQRAAERRQRRMHELNQRLRSFDDTREDDSASQDPPRPDPEVP